MFLNQAYFENYSHEFCELYICIQLNYNNMCRVTDTEWYELQKFTNKKNHSLILTFILFSEIEDVVNAVLFLLSDKASYINGVTLPIEGGLLIA